MMLRTTRIVVTALLVLAPVAGCSGQSATEGTQEFHQIRLRDVSGLSVEDSRFLFLAEEELVSRCMAARGFRYVAVAPPKDAEEPEAPYGNDDVEWARRYGFGKLVAPRSVLAEFERTHPNRTIVERLTPDRRRAYGQALTGDLRRQVAITLPDGSQRTATVDGCVADVRRRLYGDLRSWLMRGYQAQNIGQQVRARVIGDPRYTDAVARWRSCMQERGYRYEDPGTARRELGALLEKAPDPIRLRDREVAVAVADAECAARVGLVAAAVRLDLDLRAIVLAENEGVVVAYRDQQASALQRAKELLAK
jgi:hypothetical protein